MGRKFAYIASLIFGVVSSFWGQSKMIVGDKHTLFAEIPVNWLQVQDGPVPLFLKPDTANVSEKTYLYVFGHDYDTAPDMDNWINVENKYQLDTNKGVVISELKIPFDNFKADNFLTGRYKVITYSYLDKSEQLLLVIECKDTIVCAVLNTVDKGELERYYDAFVALGKSVKILGST